MTVNKLLTEQHLEFLSLKGDCKGLSESMLVKMPHCWKSHVVARLCILSRIGYSLIYQCKLFFFGGGGGVGVLKRTLSLSTYNTCFG